jgi:hypothetical protein
MGTNAAEYATHLLDVARAFRHTQTRRSVFPAPAMARPSHLERRVRVMLNPELNHAPLTRLAGIAVAVGLVGITIPIAGLVAASNDPGSALSPSNVAATTRSISGDQLLPADQPAMATYRLTPVASMQTQLRGSDDSHAPATVAYQLKPVASVQTQLRVSDVSLAVVPKTLPIAGQTPPAGCSGTLMDATGRAMSGVTIALVNSATAQRVDVRTDEGGQFSITGLPAGSKCGNRGDAGCRGDRSHEACS